jgi:hypothetical protein
MANAFADCGMDLVPRRVARVVARDVVTKNPGRKDQALK